MGQRRPVSHCQLHHSSASIHHTFTAVCFSATSEVTCADVSGTTDKNCTNKNIPTVSVTVWRPFNSLLNGDFDFYLYKYKSVISEDIIIVCKKLPYIFTRSSRIFLSVHSVHSCAMEFYFCEYSSWQNTAEQPFRVSVGSRESAVLVFSITILSSQSVTDASYSCVN